MQIMKEMEGGDSMKLFKGFGHQKKKKNKPAEGERTNHTPIPLDENLVSNMKKIRAAFC
ncbi:hypothetical protein GCM10020331_021040 [Ectobacillus funiculus]